MFFTFCPNSLFQTPIMFSLHPNGSLRRSRWPCRPRTSLSRALPDEIPPGGAIQGDRREFVHHPGVDGQTATRRGQTASPCSPTVRPPAPGGPTSCLWNRGPRPCFKYMRTCSCSGGETFGINRWSWSSRNQSGLQATRKNII
jgi:hypothetical protein